MAPKEEEEKKGGGHLLPQFEALPTPHPPPKETMAKISYFLKNFGFLPPLKHISSPCCFFKKLAGATTNYND